MPPLTPTGRIPPLFSGLLVCQQSLACRRIPPVSRITRPSSPCLCPRMAVFCKRVSFPSKDTSHIGLRSILTTASQLDYNCQDPISKQSEVKWYWGLGHQHISQGMELTCNSCVYHAHDHGCQVKVRNLSGTCDGDPGPARGWPGQSVAFTSTPHSGDALYIGALLSESEGKGPLS